MDEIHFEQKGSLAIVTLNRPKALNALTLDMVRAFAPRLEAWEEDPEIAAVLIKGAGEKAFCAGGDVRAAWDAGREFAPAGGYDPMSAPEDCLPRRFFLEEYRLNRRIHRFPKPYIALLDGVTMGGGLGLSVHGSWRIATERCLSAMPETAIGLFPDIGGTWFLNKAPGMLGRYLALTGARLKGIEDAVYAGFATHGMSSEVLESFESALVEADYGDSNESRHAAVSAIVDRFASEPGESALAASQDEIDRCFGRDSVMEVLSALEGDNSDWACETVATIRGRSPTSVKLSFQQLMRGADLTEIEDVLTMEFRMIQRCMAGHDFYEGIRAVLVDKDHKPAWNPDSLEAITDDMIANFFTSLGDRDLSFS